jgi:DNA-binding GntR family transcriptional regulator
MTTIATSPDVATQQRPTQSFSEMALDWSLVPRRTVEHQVAEFLREKIIAGLIARGQKLKQAELAKSLGVSITPVREALRLLEAQGYVQVSAHRGAVVAPFLIEHVEEHFGLRMLLEPQLAYHAAKRLTPSDFAILKKLNDEMVSAGPNAPHRLLRENNFRFHYRLYERADQPQTLEFVRILWAKYPFDLLTLIPNRPNNVFIEHENILKALKTGDAKRTMTAMATHIKAGWQAFDAMYPSPPRKS